MNWTKLTLLAPCHPKESLQSYYHNRGHWQTAHSLHQPHFSKACIAWPVAIPKQTSQKCNNYNMWACSTNNRNTEANVADFPDNERHDVQFNLNIYWGNAAYSYLCCNWAESGVSFILQHIRCQVTDNGLSPVSMMDIETETEKWHMKAVWISSVPSLRVCSSLLSSFWVYSGVTTFHRPLVSLSGGCWGVSLLWKPKPENPMKIITATIREEQVVRRLTVVKRFYRSPISHSYKTSSKVLSKRFN